MIGMNEFQALIHSLGEQILAYVGKQNLSSVRIWGDELSGTARVSLSLARPSWGSEGRAIDKMVDVREMFLTELSIEYSFDDSREGAVSDKVPAVSLSFA